MLIGSQCVMRNALCNIQVLVFIRVFPKVDHPLNISRILLVDQWWIIFCLRFAKDLAKITQGFGKIILNMVNIYQIFG